MLIRKQNMKRPMKVTIALSLLFFLTASNEVNARATFQIIHDVTPGGVIKTSSETGFIGRTYPRYSVVVGALPHGFSYISDQAEDRITHYKIYYTISVDSDAPLGTYSFKAIYYLYGEISIIPVDALEASFTINVVHDLPISPAIYLVIGIIVVPTIATVILSYIRRRPKFESEKAHDEDGHFPVDNAHFNSKQQRKKEPPPKTLMIYYRFNTKPSCVNRPTTRLQ